MAQPMVGGIYTADPDAPSLRATMPRLLEMERRHRSLILAMWKAARKSETDARHARIASGARYSLFLSFDEGTQLLTDTLAARLPQGTTRLNTKVESLKLEPLQLEPTTNPQSPKLEPHKLEPTKLESQLEPLKLEPSRLEPTTNSESPGLERLKLESPRLEDEPRRWILKTDGGETIEADAVCLALPAYAAARLLAGVDREL